MIQHLHDHGRLLLTMCIFSFCFLIDDVDEVELEPSSNIEDMSAKSAETIILVFFGVVSIHFLTVKKHSLPLGKALNVKCRSKGKYQILLPLAKVLVKDGHVKIDAGDPEINYRNITRREVKRITDVELLTNQKTESDSSALDDSTSVRSQSFP